MSPSYDWDIDLAREAHRLRALGRTPEDIGTLLGLHPEIVRALFGHVDEPGTV